MSRLKVSTFLDYFVGVLTREGNSLRAKKITRHLFKKIRYKYKVNAFTLFYFVIMELRPAFKLTSLRLGPRVYSIAAPLTFVEQYKGSIRLFLSVSKKRPERGIVLKLYKEAEDAVIGKKGLVIKEIITNYKVGFENRNFGHYRW